MRLDLQAEALRLCRLLCDLLLNESEVFGLFALIALSVARAVTRMDERGQEPPLHRHQPLEREFTRRAQADCSPAAARRRQGALRGRESAPLAPVRPGRANQVRQSDSFVPSLKAIRLVTDSDIPIDPRLAWRQSPRDTALASWWMAPSSSRLIALKSGAVTSRGCASGTETMRSMCPGTPWLGPPVMTTTRSAR
jgi:hypothetical protein